MAFPLGSQKQTIRQRISLLGKNHNMDDFISNLKSMADISQEHFSNLVRERVEKSGGKFLFEFPSVLLDGDTGKKRLRNNGGGSSSVAVLDITKNDCHLLFVRHDAKTDTVDIVAEQNAPEKLVEFAWSYAKVLSMLSQSGTEAVQ